ncbi:MAG: rhodanese-like domain-containing protein [Candidatus Zixiibacteriota bacterium]|jgi:rhodanese-related sulfurtransferase
MTKHRNILFAIAFLAIALSGTIATYSLDRTEHHSEASVSAAQLQTMIDSGDKFALVDVRRPGEYRSGHIPGAELIPLDKIQAGYFPLAKNQEIILYCRSGHRSGIALSILSKRGYQNIRHLEGGIHTWKSTLVPGDSPTGIPSQTRAN